MITHLPPQEITVLRHLFAEGSITNAEAQIVHRIRALPRRISTLVDRGVRIAKEDRRDVTGQRYRRYCLLEIPKHLEGFL